MTRKLATIQRIKELIAIPGADRIELAIINGWQVVVNKGLYAVGDRIVYLEIDSWVPTAIAPFLTEAGKEPKEYNGVKGERLKTKKLRKQLSQGLVLQLTPETTKYEVGDDVSEVLGIQKWEMAEKNPDSSPTGSKTRSFPYFLRKTDQERIQNYGHLVDKARDEKFEVTMKKDGSSMTVFRVDPTSKYYKDAQKLTGQTWSMLDKVLMFVGMRKPQPVYGICSRNCMLPLGGESNFHKAAQVVLAGLERESEFNSTSYAVQGEVVAPDIQGNYEKVKDVEFHMFDLFDINSQTYELPAARRDFADTNNIPHVKVVDLGTLTEILRLQDGDDVVKKALVYAEGDGDNAGVRREGVVFKSMTRDFSFKAVSNEYLLATGK